MLQAESAIPRQFEARSRFDSEGNREWPGFKVTPLWKTWARELVRYAYTRGSRTCTRARAWARSRRGINGNLYLCERAAAGPRVCWRSLAKSSPGSHDNDLITGIMGFRGTGVIRLRPPAPPLYFCLRESLWPSSATLSFRFTHSSRIRPRFSPSFCREIHLFRCRFANEFEIWNLRRVTKFHPLLYS